MFRLLSGHEWSGGGEAREGSGREEERGYLVSGSKNRTFTEARPRSVGGCGQAKTCPSRSGHGQCYDNLNEGEGPLPLLLHLLSVGGFDQASGYWVMDWKGLLKHYRARLKGDPQVA